MAYTAKRGIFHPDLDRTGVPDVPRDMYEQATTTEAAIEAGITDRVRAGSVLLTGASASRHTMEVVFDPDGAAFTQAPAVSVNLEQDTASAWLAQAANVTTSGFTLVLKSASGTAGPFTNARIGWIAVSTAAV